MSAIYLLEDLFPGEGIYGTAEVRNGLLYVEMDGGSPFSYGTYNTPDEWVAVRAKVWNSISHRRRHTRCEPFFPVDREAFVAEVTARVVNRIRLSPEELLQNQAFVALAWKAAKKGKSYLAEMLAWERKAVCVEAVKRVVTEYDAVQAREAVRMKEAADAAEARRLAEKPTVDAVLAAYHSCGYFQAVQGHDVLVELIGPDRPLEASTVRCDVFNGVRYSSRCTYSKRTSRHLIRVRHDWCDVVRKLGKSTLGGCLILDAQEDDVVLEVGHRVFQVKVARQGRGTSLTFDWLRYVPALGRTVTRRDRVVNKRVYLAEAVGLLPDAPDYVLNDALEEAGIAS